MTNTNIEITTNNLIFVRIGASKALLGRIAPMHNIRAKSVNVYTRGTGRDLDVPHKFEGQVYTLGTPCDISKEFETFCINLVNK